MPLLNDLADPNYRPQLGPSCTVAVLLETLEPKTAKTLKAALDNPHAPSTKIAQALQELGHRISVHVVQRHRRHQCRCS